MLDRYQDRRDARRTPEPFGTPGKGGSDDTFVIQEHHARSLHWDLRLERGGVLVSWAVPKGLPPDPKINHLAVHTEDHPMEYAAFEGEIPRGEYGGGTVTIWDRGSYETEKWSDREIKFVLHGDRVSGRFVLFQTDGKNWIIHRMDAAARDPLPPADPMLPVRRVRAPKGLDQYAVEFAWGGRRTIATIDGGRTDLPLLRPLAEHFGSRTAMLDGEIVTLRGTEVFVCYDVLYDDGINLTEWTYTRRHKRLKTLNITGTHWTTAPTWHNNLQAVRQAAREQGLPGVVLKRMDSTYTGGESRDWVLLSSE